MLRLSPSLNRISRPIRRLSSPFKGLHTLRAVDIIVSRFNAVDINDFREKAFIPEKPILVTTKDERASQSAEDRGSFSSLPATDRWFSAVGDNGSILSQEYLTPFKDTILPYEFMINPEEGSIRNWIQAHGASPNNQVLTTILTQFLQNSTNITAFHRFNAPLSLFLHANKYNFPCLKSLYIAQAQLIDLPKQLRDDLPTPEIVKEAGKGDIYDANIWMGMAPTYTPLHKDPNPNLFVQLASSKRVRLFRPVVGSAMFREVQRNIGGSGSAALRGEEMMEGPERNRLNEIVWSEEGNKEGFEIVVGPGDALFIPKGWWHSIKSVGTEVTASVNWWFR